jgi:hypothetical protein
MPLQSRAERVQPGLVDAAHAPLGGHPPAQLETLRQEVQRAAFLAFALHALARLGVFFPAAHRTCVRDHQHRSGERLLLGRTGGDVLDYFIAMPAPLGVELADEGEWHQQDDRQQQDGEQLEGKRSVHGDSGASRGGERTGRRGGQRGGRSPCAGRRGREHAR